LIWFRWEKGFERAMVQQVSSPDPPSQDENRIIAFKLYPAIFICINPIQATILPFKENFKCAFQRGYYIFMFMNDKIKTPKRMFLFYFLSVT